MNRLNIIKKNLIDPALKASDIVALEKASTILHAIAEAEKIQVDILAAHRASRSESLRFWIPILAPVITALALIGTLAFQIQQFKETAKAQRLADEKNTQSQRLANEDTQWREVITLAKSNEGPASSFALTLIKSFFESDRYKKQAREIAAVLLGGIAEPIIFNDNLASLLEKTDWENFKDIANISKTQVLIYSKIRQDAEDVENQRRQKKSNVPQFGFENDPIFLRRNFETNITTLSKGLVQFLRDPQHSPRPANITLDLSGCGIWGQDISNMDLRGAKVEGIWFYDSNLSGANFSGSNLVDALFNSSNVSGADFSDVQGGYSTWNNTAWWRAKRMSPELLQHVQEYYKFSEKTKYKDDTTKDYSEYQKEVERLTKNSGGAETAATPQASPTPTRTETPAPPRNANAAPPREGNANTPTKRTPSGNSRNTNTGNRNAATPTRNANRRPPKKH